MKLLITGASGLVGSAVARLAGAAGHEVTGVVGRWRERVPGTTGLLARDLARPGEGAELIHGLRPDAVVNAAAIADPGACETAPDLSQRLNVEFPAELALAAAQAGVRLLHLSSEQVFDGEHAPYAETDPARPLNLYGRQKLASEQRVLGAAPTAAVVRIPLLLGNSLTSRRSVHEKLFELWATGEPARLYVDEIRQVCSADSVARVLLALAARAELTGIFHWAGAEPVSRHELGQRLARHFGAAPERLIAVRRADTPAASAKRPRDLSLTIAPLARALALTPEPLAAAIAPLQRPPWAAPL